MEIAVIKPNGKHNVRYRSVVGEVFAGKRVIADWSEHGKHWCLCQCADGKYRIYLAGNLKKEVRYER